MERGLEVLANYMQKGFWGGKGIASRTVMMTLQRADNKTKKCKGVICFTRKRSINHRTRSDVKKTKNDVRVCPMADGKESEKVPNIGLDGNQTSKNVELCM